MGASDEDGTREHLTDLGHLSAAVSHHVINAFGAIVSNAELLRMNLRPERVDPVVLADTIVRTALDASAVARRLIDVSRPITSIEPDRAVFATAKLSLDQLVGEVVTAARESSEGPAIDWVARLEPTPEMRGHPDHLRAMLARLIDNAREAMPPAGGTIRLSTGIDSRGWIVLEIRDSGQGMDPPARERALEPFFSTKPGHLGIGLSIANAIWRRHHGTFAIQSQPGAGTLIRLAVDPGRP